MQRFLLFILIVTASCIALTRVFLNNLYPVELVAATDAVKIPFNKPVFNYGQVLINLTWTKTQVVYLCKILMLAVIVVVAVLNYKKFMSELPEGDDQQ